MNRTTREAIMNGRLIDNGNLIIRNIGTLSLLILGVMAMSATAAGQVPVDENGKPIGTYREEGYAETGPDDAPDAGKRLSAAELEELVGPVALYPDDLLAIVLPASAYPLEIVQAARFLERLETDNTLKPDEAWDESIIALLNYPDVVRMLDEDIDWTWRLGEAVISQQNDVIAAVESFRDRAYAAGNLKTDEHQEVSVSEGIIEIVPVDEEIIYVPYYEPAEVVVYQPRPVYRYYPDPYPVYYYPYPAGYRFRSGYFWGVTTAFSIGWSNHYLHVYHPSYWGHPYYGSYYYGHYYRRPSITVYNNWYVNNRYRNSRHQHRDGDYWRPRDRAGSRQGVQRVRNYEYSPNGSRNSRDFEVSRRERLRVGDDGRMDMNLRERDSNRTANNASRQSQVSPARTTGSRNTERRSESRAEIQFRDRAADTRVTNDRATSRTDTVGRNRTTTTASAESRRPSSTTRQNVTRTAPATRSATPGVRQRNATSRSSTLPATRNTPPPRVSTPTVRQNTSSRRSPTPPRTSAPAPRVSTPSIQRRAPAAPRTNTRSSGRGESGASRNRQSSSQRIRSNQN